MDSSICSAIGTRALMAFSYDAGERVVEPYCHGFSRAGNEVLRAYQVDGFSASGNPNPWRLYTVEKMLDIRVLPGTFTTNRDGYNPADSQMTTIHCHV